jgi:hypothetical protein
MARILVAGTDRIEQKQQGDRSLRRFGVAIAVALEIPGR